VFVFFSFFFFPKKQNFSHRETDRFLGFILAFASSIHNKQTIVFAAFFQLQEFTLRNMTVESSNFRRAAFSAQIKSRQHPLQVYIFPG
jgi:hypothetical protein